MPRYVQGRSFIVRRALMAAVLTIGSLLTLAPQRANASTSPSSFDFGSVQLRNTSAPHDFVVTFPDPTVGFKDAATSGGPFVLTDSTSCDAEAFVTPASPCKLSVAFRPVGANNPGLFVGFLDIVYSNGTSDRVSLRGTETDGVNVMPSSFDFGTVPVGGSSAPHTFTVSFPNPTVGFKSAGAGGAFVITDSRSCDAESFVEPATPCTISVAFRPRPGDLEVGAFFVSYTDGGGDRIPLSGTIAPSGGGIGDTNLTYVGPASSDFHDAATLSAILTSRSAGNPPIVGALISFSLAAQSCSGTTDSTGRANCSIVPSEAAGGYMVVASFSGDSNHQASSASAPFAVTLEETRLAYAGDTHGANGTPLHLAGVLREDGSAPVPSRSIGFTLGTGSNAQSCNGVTDVNGLAGCTIASVSQPPGSTSVGMEATFPGDADYLPASTSATLLIEYMTGRAYGLAAALTTPLGSLALPPTPDTGAVVSAAGSTTSTPCLVAGGQSLVSVHGLCVNVKTMLAPGRAVAVSTVADATIATGIPGVPVVTVGALQATSTSTCGAESGTTTIASLVVGGVPIYANAAPNTVVLLTGPLGGKLILNEQKLATGPGGDRVLTVNAVHLIVPTTFGTSGDVILASATSDIHNCP